MTGKANKAVTAMLAKFARPQSNQPLLRERLFAKLDALPAQIVWVAAAPGSGKTTLVSSFIAKRGLSHWWYQLDANDSDSVSFFHYLNLAVKAHVPELGNTLPILTPHNSDGVEMFARHHAETLALNKALPDVIVFDNYEALSTQSPLHAALHSWLACLPRSTRVIVLSRSEPPALFARMRLYGELVILDGVDLNLTEAEAQALSSFRAQQTGTPIAAERVGLANRDSQGWIAGFLLLLADTGNVRQATRLAEGEAGQLLFDYFVTELFAQLDPAIQTAMAKTALLPTMTLAQAEQMAETSEIIAVLQNMHRKNCFIVCRGYEEPVYEYHALFRAFLLNFAKYDFAADTWRALQQRAATLLAASAQADQAAVLFQAAQDWPGLAALVLQEASAMLATGRHLTLGKWLDALPSTFKEGAPWLHFWHGMARLPYVPTEARGYLEQAYALFQHQDDGVGLYSTWAAIMDTFFYEWHDLKPADWWINEFDALRARHPNFPNQAIELRICWAIGTLLHRQPQHPYLPTWAERAYKLLDTQHELAILVGGYLLIWLLWRGETASANDILTRLVGKATNRELSPTVAILYHCALAFYYSVRGEGTACKQTVQDGLALADKAGQHCWDFLLAAQTARCCLINGDLPGADKWLAMMAQTMRDHSHINGGFYQHLRANAALQRGDWGQALKHARSALTMAEESGVPFLEAHCRIDLARALLAQGKETECMAHVVLADRIGNTMGSKVIAYLCMELNAEVAYQQGQAARAEQNLAQALALSQKMDGATWLMAGPKSCAGLYNRALQSNIATAHVQQLITRRHLRPLDPSNVAENWPWTVKIYTLGRFEICCDGQPLNLGGKPQHKPLELLKCLCALGAHPVHQDQISDALWPDALGDAAEQALRTTLYRLRKLLRCEPALKYEARHLSWDENYTWVDCLAFERSAYPIEHLDQHALRRLLNRYQGHFLPGDSAPWAIAMREKLRAQFLRIAGKYGDGLEQEGDWRAATDCYQQVIAIEPVAERFHRRLIACHIKHGQSTEALAAYQHCRQTLFAHLGVSPTQETQALFLQISNALAP